MNVEKILLVVILYLCTDFLTCVRKNRVRGAKWWNLAHSMTSYENLLPEDIPLFANPSLKPLTKKQRRQVNKNPGTLQAITTGLRMSIDECKMQFHNRRWNCPTSDSNHGASVFSPIVKTGSPETSYIYALTSGAVVHAVSRSCSEGTVYTCSCGHQKQYYYPHSVTPNDWEWGGCSDNIDFGHTFSRDFVDVIERGRDIRNMMNLHNNEAGRLHVVSQMRTACKCHGMSGSCTLKTCWMSLSPYRKTALSLKDRFDGATQVYIGNGGSIRSRMKTFKFNLIPVNKNHKPPGRMDLVYFDESPNFCEPSPAIKYKGTKGRHCNATYVGIDGCDIMCCGRGHKTESYKVKERCFCQFHWCCEVTCQICNKIKLRHTCL